jgi:hypothetical protein
MPSTVRACFDRTFPPAAVAKFVSSLEASGVAQLDDVAAIAAAVR